MKRKSNFFGKKVLITGATGLIGKTMVFRLLSYGAEVYAIVRDTSRAQKIFGSRGQLHFIEADITTAPLQNLGIDYMIHGAANTSSRAFVKEPVSIVKTNIGGTIRMLELAKQNPVKSFIFLSSMEVYGTPSSDEKILETYSSNLDTMSVRSCYPESKRQCENLCTCYATQFGIPAKVIRLTQTFGPGVSYNDQRVFAEFARCVIEGKDIVLHTKGDTKRCYLYTEDATDAVFYVLLFGNTGEAYNAANEATYCSIYEMASMVAKRFGKGRVSVRIQEDNPGCFGYAPTLHMNLDTGKLRKLGWQPKTGLEEMFARLVESMGRLQ